MARPYTGFLLVVTGSTQMFDSFLPA